MTHELDTDTSSAELNLSFSLSSFENHSPDEKDIECVSDEEKRGLEPYQYELSASESDESAEEKADSSEESDKEQRLNSTFWLVQI